MPGATAKRTKIINFLIGRTIEVKMMDRLIYFWGRECPHCAKLHPVVEDASKEIAQPIEQLEVWHSAENAQLMESYSKQVESSCGSGLGVPTLYNEKTGKAICGDRLSKENIIDWANER
ncbi:YbbN family protein [Candidatus Methanomassiliicoccus intestinalis]|uniref:Thioredoxin domain-containing protein n=1 Tax=Candidatus Methanomassiliicoccus intestinalis TaxID=1406512 RepID=A0A8J8TFH6_9ARCH|nr:MAG: hypothetical protein A3207_00075 [Candidatus Methanomassiliicoccus intestinalis]